MFKISSPLRLYQNLLYGTKAKTFEERLLISSVFFISVFQLVSIFFNWSMNLGESVLVLSISGTILMLLLYFFFRFYGIPRVFYFITVGYMLVFNNVVWLINFGSKGPAFMFYIVLLSFVILLFPKKYYLLFVLILVFDVLVLFYLEYFHKIFIGAYPSRDSRVIDNYFSFLVSIPVVLWFLSVIKRNYMHECERARTADRLKSAFLANMSHEIRTPLNAVVGFSALMLDEEVSEEDKKMFSLQVMHNSEHLINLIEDIIDVSKIESNQLEIKLREVDLVPLLNEVIQSFRMPPNQNSNVKIVNNLGVSTLVVMTDRVRFEQILRNLLSNALKFTAQGIVEISYTRDKDYYTFIFKDTGIGIDAEHQKLIFERFVKVDNSKQLLYRGTGLGLFLTREIVDRLGGKIWVESTPGEGSTFYFTIPV